MVAESLWLLGRIDSQVTQGEKRLIGRLSLGPGEKQSRVERSPVDWNRQACSFICRVCLLVLFPQV